MNPVRPEHRSKEMEGIRGTLLQARSAVRGASSALEAVRPMMTEETQSEFTIIAGKIRDFEQMIYARYEATYED
jgi:hypothetical protein